MRARWLYPVLAVMCLAIMATGSINMAMAAAITDTDSTQPRGAPLEGVFVRNPGHPELDNKLHLGPVVQGFRGPQFRASANAEFAGIYHDEWKGMPMANIMRDPAQFAMVSAANRDFILYLNSLYGCADEPGSELYEALKALELVGDVQGCYNDLSPKDLLPVTADLCNRCHSPVGWMEGHSEPPTQAFPFLRGQFWTSAFLEFPGHRPPLELVERGDDIIKRFFKGNYWAGDPRTVQLNRESEAEMEGIQCDFCHREYTGFNRRSLFDRSVMSKGNGTFFVNRYNVLRSNDAEVPNPDLVNVDELAPPLEHGGFEPYHEFLHSAELCGTCHDVSNPLIRNKTKVKDELGRTVVPDMPMPIERTYTEWYWSGYRTGEDGTAKKVCQDCHIPMEFPGSQTWLLYPGIKTLWNNGKLDIRWTEAPFNYIDNPDRSEAYLARANGNRAFMKGAASVSVDARYEGMKLVVDVKVENHAGHKIPTGYPEGRQMWIQLEGRTTDGEIVFEDGKIGEDGKLIRTSQTKVYEAVPIAVGYENNLYKGYSILDRDKSGVVTHEEKEFHFVLNNYMEKDNRIPPKGFIRAAYTADGAFIVPRDPQDHDYEDGQNWDVTTYEFDVDTRRRDVTVQAKLMFQTFNKEFIDYLSDADRTNTIRFDGPARNTPNGPYYDYARWGKVIEDLWYEADKGKPVLMASDADRVMAQFDVD